MDGFGVTFGGQTSVILEKTQNLIERDDGIMRIG
jgi:hypothetical protein